MNDEIKKYLFLVYIVLVLAIFTQFLGFNTKQVFSISIIVLFISATFMFWETRLTFGFFGIFLLFLLNVIDIKHFVEFASLDIIIFLISMMIFIGYIERSHLFEFMIGKIIGFTKNSGKLLIFILLIISAILAALVDEVTSILVMTAVMIHITTQYKVSPLPFVLMSVFATNIGSSATVVGNPVGVMIALNGGLSFGDFLRWATPISAAALVVSIILINFLFRKELNEFEKNFQKFASTGQEILLQKRNILAPLILFFMVLLGLVFHKQIEYMLHLEKNTLLIGFSMLGAAAAMFLSKDKAPELVERRVDWWTILFFMFLFASVGSLKYTGVIDVFSGHISNLTGSDIVFTILIIMLIGGLLSAVLDNVLAVAIMIPIIDNLNLLNPSYGTTLWWPLLFAGTFFGNMTFIGSTANLVALGVLNKRKLGNIGFFQWLKYGFFITISTAIVAFILLFIQLPLLMGG